MSFQNPCFLPPFVLAQMGVREAHGRQQGNQQKHEPCAKAVKSATLGESGRVGNGAPSAAAGDLERAAAGFSRVLSPLYLGFFRTPPPGILM